MSLTGEHQMRQQVRDKASASVKDTLDKTSAEFAFRQLPIVVLCIFTLLKGSSLLATAPANFAYLCLVSAQLAESESRTWDCADPDGVRRLFEQALRRDSKLDTAWYGLARLGDTVALDKQLSAYLESTRVERLLARAEILEAFGEYDSANMHYRAVVAQEEMPVAYLGLGATYQRLGDLEAAIDAYREAVGENHRDSLSSRQLATAYHQLGKIYLTSGQLGYAEECLKVAASNDPLHVEIYLALGEVYLSKGEEDRALTMFTKAVNIDPSAKYRLTIGIHLLKHGNYEHAQAWFTEASALTPTQGEPRAYLGMAYHWQGKLEQAVQNYQLAIELEPQNAHFHHWLGLALLDAQNADLARYHLRRALAIMGDRNPIERASIHLALGDAYSLGKNETLANREYELAFELNPNLKGARDMRTPTESINE